MKEYTVKVNGLDHTFQLDDDEAKRLGVREKEAKAPANKARTAQNK